jgi:hypothetical protein
MTQHGLSAGGLGLATETNLFQRVYACLACGAVLLPGAAAAAHPTDDFAADHNREAAFATAIVQLFFFISASAASAACLACSRLMMSP